MRTAYEFAMDALEQMHAGLAARVPAPRLVSVSDMLAYRYLEKTPQQAIVLKSAAAITHLRASLVLLDHTYLLSQSALQRLIDEANDDVWFLALALIHKDWTPQHDRFMAAMFAEEFGNASDIVATGRRRNMVPRRKILSYIARAGGAEDPHRDISVADSILALFSGFVHGAAQHILETYGGRPPRFNLAGMKGSNLVQDHLDGSWNYVYRTLQAMHLAAMSFGDDELLSRSEEEILKFTSATGRTGDSAA